jgi:DNA polymerase III alpha subunit
MEELLELDKKNEKIKKQREKQKDEIVSVVWVINDIRKIITKSEKTMIFLKCEWFDYDFEVVIFPKDVEKYIEKLEVDKIVIVNWNLQINFEYNRKSIQARDIKIASISQVREQAFDLWLFDNQKRFLNLKLNKLEEESNNKKCKNSCEIYSEDFDKNLEEKIQDSKIIDSRQLDKKEFIIQIPQKAKKQDLLDLKEFLSRQTSGQIKIFINLKWQKIDTKFNLDSLENLEKWIGKKW